MEYPKLVIPNSGLKLDQLKYSTEQAQIILEAVTVTHGKDKHTLVIKALPIKISQTTE